VNHSPVLGEDYFHWVMLRLGQAQLMLNDTYESNTERPSEPDLSRTAAHGDTALYFACHDVDAAYEELAAKASL
jgi:glyoxylase I family protein